MTDEHEPDEHLTDEQLSAHLDGVYGDDLDENLAPPVDEHLAGCARCRQRSAALGAVRRIMQAPVPPLAPEVRSASIAAVLRRAEIADPPDAADAGPAPTSLGRRRPQVLVGVAAAIVVLGTAIGVPVALSGRSTPSSSEASRPAARQAQQTPAGSSGAARAAGTGGPPEHFSAVIANLGNVESVGALRGKVAALEPHASAAVPTTPTGSASASAPAGSPQSAVDGTTISRFEGCLSAATHAAGSGQALHFAAIATFRGTSALVYVFEPGSGRSSSGGAVRSTVVATARVGCRVLGTTQL